jgi:hypothetical protein
MNSTPLATAGIRERNGTWSHSPARHGRTAVQVVVISTGTDWGTQRTWFETVRRGVMQPQRTRNGGDAARNPTIFTI